MGGEFDGELVIDNIRVYGFLEHDVDLDGDRELFDFAACEDRSMPVAVLIGDADRGELGTNATTS